MCGGWLICQSSTPPLLGQPRISQTLDTQWDVRTVSMTVFKRDRKPAFFATCRLTKSSQKFMASWQSPQLHTDGHLNRKEREILLLLPRLKLDQHLVELQKRKQKTILVYFSYLVHWRCNHWLESDLNLIRITLIKHFLFFKHPTGIKTLLVLSRNFFSQYNFCEVIFSGVCEKLFGHEGNRSPCCYAE